MIGEDVLDRAIEVIQQTPTLKTVQISGLGEPLTNPNFCHILKRIEKETKIRRVWFFTNGMLLTPEISKRIAKSKLDVRIVVSIDGATPEENNFLSERIGLSDCSEKSDGAAEKHPQQAVV